MFRRAKVKFCFRPQKWQFLIRWGIAFFLLIMKTPDSQLKCHSRRCNQQALIVHRRQWFCVVHALVSARIRQFIRSLRGGE
jgi:uncharacterized membrane protein YwaF